ncbi:MAG TPA: homoserine dehydrogenase [Nitrososphaeraceae archaeon]|nr:homoserine dehydrogenase [Nitrososphaeraceae archaeon]
MRLILLGFGVVGQSFVKLLVSHSTDLYNVYGIKPKVVACADNGGIVTCDQGLNLDRLLNVKKKKKSVAQYGPRGSTSEIVDVIENLDAEVVIELTPTNITDGEPGKNHIITAMKSGKNVITVNKGPLALEFPSLIELAEYNRIAFKFSGTVGGGTPILEFAKRCLRGDRIISFEGILNGTTNYILSKMYEGLNFSQALRNASEKGYAEKDPTLDIEGYDAVAKLVIASNFVMNLKSTINDVRRTGIRDIRASEVVNERKKGNAIKLIASCDGKKLIVGPKPVSTKDPICVDGILNAITFTCQHSGQQTIIGKGAGGMETASSILRDLIDIRSIIRL